MRVLLGTEITVLQWGVFAGVVLVLLAIDLITLGRETANTRRATIVWSTIWIGTGLAFAGYVWGEMGADAAQSYLAAYLIEKSLSLDNLFMFMLIFQSLRIEKTGQHKVLFWGIIGAVVFRGIFILLGARALEQFDWVSYVFGGLLVYAAYRAFREDPLKERESTIVAWLSRRFPVSDRSERTRFIERQNGRRVATPLFIALLAVEATDILFAIDSVPAALSMTRNLFLVYSSNIFAILGLRALYLVLARTIADAEYLHVGLAVVLAFAGFKIVAYPWIHIPPYISVAFIVAVIWVALWASLRKRRRTGAPPTEEMEEV